MSEWWTYRLSDFVMFSARTYRRLFELYNADTCLLHLVVFGLASAVLLACARGRTGALPALCALLAAGWLWVAWAFHLRRYATINWAATWFAAAFAIQGALMLLVALRARLRPGSGNARARAVGLGLLLFAIAGQPLLARLLGRPWPQAEVLGLAPDPTAIGTLGLLLLLRPGEVARSMPTRALLLAPWAIPLLWCVIGGATLWAMQAPEAALMPCAGLLAAVVAMRTRR